MVLLSYNSVVTELHLFSGLRIKTLSSLYNDFLKVLHLLTQESIPASC